MNISILYAIISAVLAWLASFLIKVSAEKDHNPFLFTTYSFFSIAFFSFVFYLFSGIYVDRIFVVLLLWMIMWTSYLILWISKIEALKQIDSIIYFPIYKVSSTIWAVIVWLYFFHENLNINETIWIILWLLVPIILINKKEKIKQKDLLKWILFCLLSWFFAVITIIISKLINIYNLNLYFYLFVWWFAWGVLSLLQYNRDKDKKTMSTSKIKRWAILNWLLISIWSVFFVKALSWNLAVTYTINSFSILIPIILSIFFYEERLNLRKIIALILTILSILFFKVF